MSVAIVLLFRNLSRRNGPFLTKRLVSWSRRRGENVVAVNPVRISPFFWRVVTWFNVVSVSVSPGEGFQLRMGTFSINYLGADFKEAPKIRAVVISTMLFHCLRVISPDLRVRYNVNGRERSANIVFSTRRHDLTVRNRLPSFYFRVTRARDHLLHVSQLVYF